MPDDLYDRDALAWSERQATLLRRVARGERVNDVDWDHVVEEIEDVGLSELHAVHSYLEQLLAHLLKLRGWPELGACDHWRSEIVAFQAGAVRRFTPSMRQRIDLEGAYSTAVRQIEPLRYGGHRALAPPSKCPVTLDQLLGSPREDLKLLSWRLGSADPLIIRPGARSGSSRRWKWRRTVFPTNRNGSRALLSNRCMFYAAPHQGS